MSFDSFLQNAMQSIDSLPPPQNRREENNDVRMPLIYIYIYKTEAFKASTFFHISIYLFIYSIF